jgi:hypothetical protein
VLTLCRRMATIGFSATSVDGPNAKCRLGPRMSAAQGRPDMMLRMSNQRS